MSRLSLKPGGEPGKWSFRFPIDTGGNMETTGEAWWVDVPDVPDSDLIDIRATISEYLDAKYEVCSGEPTNREPFRPPLSEPKGQTLFTFKFPLWKIAAGVAASATCIHRQASPIRNARHTVLIRSAKPIWRNNETCSLDSAVRGIGRRPVTHSQGNN